MSKHKIINLLSIIVFSVGILIMIIGLGLLSFEITDNKLLKINGFDLINILEANKNVPFSNTSINGLLDIFKSKIDGFFYFQSMKNIENIRCGVIFTLFFTPILLFISFVGFGYNYFNFYIFYKNKN